MEDFRELGRRLSNWGRWDTEGHRDQRGTTNLITPERVVAAAGSIRSGKVFDLGIPFGKDGPQTGGRRINPVLLFSETGADQDDIPGAVHFADDYVFMPLQCASQWDALAHVFYDDMLYNGFPATDITSHGAKHNSIDHQAKGIAGRGVLVDVARHRGVDWLEVGEVITPDELDAVLAAQGTEIRSGDVLAVRTGWRRKFLVEGADGFRAGEPGLGLACCEWLSRNEISAVCSDNWAIEPLPGELADESLPVHMILIRDMGMTLGEMFDLDELAQDCASDGRWDFFMAAPPIKFTGAVGSPVNPLAVR